MRAVPAPAPEGSEASKFSTEETREPESVSIVEIDSHDVPSAKAMRAMSFAQLSVAQAPVVEIEPNDTPASATPLGGTNVVARGNIYKLGKGPAAATGDVDYWSFDGMVGDQVYAATMTSWAPSSSTDTTLELLTTDGVQVLEADLDDGSISTLSSTIAGATLPETGTFYLRVRHSANASRIAPYFLHFRLQSGSPTPEVEPNDTPATANPLPASGWVSGTRDPALGTEQDWFSFHANAGDTVFLSLDLDPERDNVQWNGRVGIGLFGDAGNQTLVADDGSPGTELNPLSEALFMTVKDTGTYYALVDSATATVGGSTATYRLSVSVHAPVPVGANCTVYTSSDVPKTIGPAAGTISNSTITIPGNPRIGDLNVSIRLDHTVMSDIDATLISPAGNENSLFTDIGSTAPLGQTQMDLDLDDEAGMPPLFTALKGLGFQPEFNYRLAWFKGEAAGGTWTLRLRDDANATNGGTLTAWSLTVCEPPAAPVCTGTLVTAFSTDFESSSAGFTTSAAAPAPWQLGTPTAAPIATCHSGNNCWKTNLSGPYNPGANQDLLSPTLNLSGFRAPITVSWAQRYQLESASFDTFWAEVREVGPTNVTNLFQFLDGSMTDTIGSPAATLNESAGWGIVTRDISDYAGKSEVELRWGFVSDARGQLAGVAIDDVTVMACCDAASCDDNNPCTDDVCDAVYGCQHLINDANSCSDGNPCTNPDACLNGVCVPGVNPCEDNNVCTIDVCDGQGGCTYTPIVCDDGNLCTDDLCLASTGCTYVNNTAPCSDGDVCTIGDHCANGVCVLGTPPAAVQVCDNNPIVIPSSGAAPPYPSTIAVATGPVLCSVTVNLNGVSHTYPDDIDIMLSSPAGQNAIIMSDVGGGNPGVSGLSLVLDDAAAVPLPDAGPLVSGTYQPTNVGAGDTFSAPAPVPLGGSALSVFNGSNPNGNWNLWVVDDLSGDSGSLSGWCLNVRALCVADTDCDDGNPCTVDSCDPQTGACVHSDYSVACDDGNPCTDDLCDGLTGACSHLANNVACEDGNSCTVGDVCGNGICQPGTLIAVPPEVGGLSATDATTFTWSTAPYAYQYDVVRGLIDSLPAGPGGGDEVCFDDVVGTTIVDPTLPARGSMFWYLVRGENPCGIGTYGTQSDATPRTTTTCP